MSRCERIHMVGAYHDGELEFEECREFEEHLGQCEVCAAELRQLRAISRLIENAAAPSMSDAVRQRLYASARRVPERVVFRLTRQLTAAAAAVLIICSGFVGFGIIGTPKAPAQMPDSWELAAVQADVEMAETEAQQLAQWIVQDLSVENGHD